MSLLEIMDRLLNVNQEVLFNISAKSNGEYFQNYFKSFQVRTANLKFILVLYYLLKDNLFMMRHNQDIIFYIPHSYLKWRIMFYSVV